MLKLGECIFERGICVYLEPVCPLIFSRDPSETGSFPIKTRRIWDPGHTCNVIDHHEVEFPMNEAV